jgi:hypothetical protein
VFSYTRKQDQQQRKDRDRNESSIRGYQLTDDTRWHQLRESTCGSNLDSILEGRMGWFTIIHVKAMKKVTSRIRLGNKNSLIGLQNLEAKEIVQKN